MAVVPQGRSSIDQCTYIGCNKYRRVVGQGVSVVDVRKEISFCNKMQVPTIGIIENMSGLLCMCTRTHVCGGRVGGCALVCVCVCVCVWACVCLCVCVYVL